jgi:hypothetical protein
MRRVLPRSCKGIVVVELVVLLLPQILEPYSMCGQTEKSQVPIEDLDFVVEGLLLDHVFLHVLVLPDLGGSFTYDVGGGILVLSLLHQDN